MDSVSPIDISSDSDVEIQESAGNKSNFRANPPWLNAGNGGYQRNVSSQQVPYSLNGSSSNANKHAIPAHGKFASDYDKLSAQQAFKRTLPPSFSSPASSSRRESYVANGNGKEMHDAYRNPHRSVVPTSSIIKGHSKDRPGGVLDDSSMVRGVNVVRTLPSSISHGMPSTSSHYAGSSDTQNRFGMAEEKQFGNDERLIYQAALEDLNQPKSEHSPPDGVLSVPLLRHQKIALAWMVQKETRSLHCLGGILADDQGLGKTISMIALMQVQKPSESQSKSENMCDQKPEALDLDADDENVDSKQGGDNDVKSASGSEWKDSNNERAELLDLDDCLGNGSSGYEKVKPEEEGTSTRVFSRKRPAAGTLVVCPASVLRQWARELDEKVTDEAKLQVLIYHGGNRTKDPVELAKFDVVLTTYAIVTNEVPKQPTVDEDEADEKNMEKYGISSTAFSSKKKRKNAVKASKKGKKRGSKTIDDSYDYDCGALARVRWFRVILDEAQTIKNHRTQVARACCSLRAKRRWCLSGTPIQNTIDDLYSYFRFLKYDPYAVYRSFYTTIKVPISRNSLHGYKKLQAVLRAIMLRRTKGTLIDGEPIINLPPKSICLAKVEFSAEERAFYRQLEADSRSQFKAYAAAGTVNQNYANILLMLLRLRQACDHPLLVKGYNSGPISNVSEETVKRLSKDARVNLLTRLESSFAICLVCHDPPEDAVVTLCGHVFCYQCVSEYLTGYENSCPVPNCKEQLGRDAIFSKSTLRSCLSYDSESSSATPDRHTDKSIAMDEYSSSKIRAIIEILQSHLKPKSPNSELQESSVTNSGAPTEGPIKTIVFSQWTGMLDLVQSSLSESCIEYRRLDGTMSLAARDRAVKDFCNDPEVTVMLMSLKAGNLGLNMVAASHVILLDLWWNPTTEDQAVDRAHRIGQTRPVTVTRLTIKDTVEDRILALQEEKRKMVASAFGEDQGGGSATRLTVDDLKYLFMV